MWKEIKDKGYNGGRSAGYECLKPHTQSRNKTPLPILPQISWVPSKVSLLLYKKEELLSKKEVKLIHDLRDKSPDINTAWILAHRFREIMENKQGDLLNQWIDQVIQSSVSELKGFAKGLLSGYEAVKNALSLPWSNGQVEGQINKLKTVKRQMYGRAGFELLRKRMILGSG